MTMLLSVTNADDSKTPSWMTIMMYYQEEEDSVPVERVIYREISVPCYSLRLRTGIIKIIRDVEIEINFGDAYAHRYIWYAVSVPNKEGLQISLLRGDLRPKVSLNGVNACQYEKDITGSVRCVLCLCCLCWLHPSCLCCCRDNYADRSAEYEMI